jgi:flagellar basal body-associated protein FliL
VDCTITDIPIFTHTPILIPIILAINVILCARVTVVVFNYSKRPEKKPDDSVSKPKVLNQKSSDSKLIKFFKNFKLNFFQRWKKKRVQLESLC